MARRKYCILTIIIFLILCRSNVVTSQWNSLADSNAIDDFMQNNLQNSDELQILASQANDDAIKLLGFEGKTIFSIGLDPKNKDIIYAGTDGSGLYKSTDYGVNWKTINLGMTDNRIFAFILDHTNLNILYVGTGDATQAKSEGIFKSSNAGASWSRSNRGLPDNFIFSIAMAKSNTSILLAGTGGAGVYKTENGAKQWKAANSGITGSMIIFGLGIHPTNSNILFAGTRYGKIYKSTNGGGSWDLRELPGHSSYVYAIIFDPGKPTVMYASTDEHGVYKSVDGGDNWFQTNNGLGEQTISDLKISSSGKLYAGTKSNGLYTSEDGGKSWAHFPDEGKFNTTIHAIAISELEKEIFYVGTKNGIYRVAPYVAVPILSVSPSLLNFGTSLTSLSFQVLNKGGGILRWYTRPLVSWINSIIPSTGIGDATVTVQVKRDGLSPGTYSGKIAISSTGGSDTVNVVMTVPEQPQLSVSATSLSFSATETKKTFSIKNAGTGTLYWSISADRTWLSVSPTTGMTTSESEIISVTVDRAGLAPGDYEGTITITSNAGTKKISVSMKVAEVPVLSVNTTALSFGTTEITKTFTIGNSGTGTLTWSIRDDQTWISVSPTSGMTTSETEIISVTIDRAELAPGNYDGTITITSNGGTRSIKVSMTVPAEPILSVNPTVLSFGTSEGTMTFFITNTGTGTLSWNITDDQTWLSVFPTSGATTTETDSIKATVDRSGLAPGDYNGRITITSNGGTKSVNVSLTISEEPVLYVSPTTLSFGTNEIKKFLSIKNEGTGTLSWSISDDQTWLSVFPTNGTTVTETDSVTVMVDRSGLAPGAYNGKITVTSDDKTETVEVSMSVPQEPTLAVTPTSLSFGSTTTSKKIYVSNTGLGTLFWQAEEAQSWLTITPTSGTTKTETDSIIVIVDRSGLSEGDYSGKIRIFSDDQSVDVSVTMTVPKPPTLSVTPDSLFFSSNAISKTFDIVNSGSGILTWNLSGDQSWITATPANGTTESETDQIIVTIDRYGLAAGEYTAIITITSNGGTATVTIRMTVPIEPTLSVFPTTLSYGSSETSKIFIIKNTGGEILTWSVSDDKAWITAAPISGTTTTETDTVSVTVDRTGMGLGDYSGRVSVTSNGGNIDIPVSMTVSMGPVADFSANRTTGEAPLTVIFSDNSTGDISDWSWSFPGGSPDSASTQGPHTVEYSNPGLYSVSLTVTGPDGSSTKHKPDFITLLGGIGPSIISTIPSTIYEEDSVTVNAIISDKDGVGEVFLYYCMGGAQAYDSTAMNEISETRFQGGIPASVVTKRGVQCYIKASDIYRNVSFDPAGSGYYVIRVRVANLECPNVMPAQRYRMISVPLELDKTSPADVFIDNFGSYDNTKWRLFRHQGGNYVEYTVGNIEPFVPGRGFWLITKNDERFDVGSGLSVSTGENYRITLRPGWNMIGNPFAFPVAWTDVIKPQKIENPWGYYGNNNTTAGFQANQVQLNPWEGYVLKSLEDTYRTIEIPPMETSSSSFSKIAQIPGNDLEVDEWILQIVVSCENYVDQDNYVGCLKSSVDSWDKNDFSEPPMIGEYVSLYFPHQDWNVYPSNYSADFRQVSLQGANWEFVVETNLSQALVSLQFTDLATLPHGWGAQLIDKYQMTSQELHSISEYKYTSGEGLDQRKFELIIGAEKFVDEHNIEPVHSFGLKQNFPNPFNTSTLIEYTLPQDAWVKLTIYNMLGKEIKRLVDNKFHTPGVFKVVWDGTNHKGENIPTGLYFYSLTTEHFQQVRKIVYLR